MRLYAIIYRNTEIRILNLFKLGIRIKMKHNEKHCKKKLFFKLDN